MNESRDKYFYKKLFENESTGKDLCIDGIQSIEERRGKKKIFV